MYGHRSSARQCLLSQSRLRRKMLTKIYKLTCCHAGGGVRLPVRGYVMTMDTMTLVSGCPLCQQQPPASTFTIFISRLPHRHHQAVPTKAQPPIRKKVLRLRVARTKIPPPTKVHQVAKNPVEGRRHQEVKAAQSINLLQVKNFWLLKSGYV